MRKYFIILTMALLGAGLVSCESLRLGDAGLSKAPETSGATLDTLFSTLKDSDKVLANAYYYLPYGVLSDFDRRLGNDILESITDHYISNKHSDNNGPNDLYYNGGLSANISGGNEAYRFGGYSTKKDRDYYAIRYALHYLENADKIPNADPTQLARKKAEAKMILAIAYGNMLRYVGGVPILEHSIAMDDKMEFPRNTFAETVDYIVRMCNEAAPDLPWYVSAAEDGRLTKAAALGFKLRILCFAASPTFNSDTPWHPKADKYVCYGNYDASRWQAAKDAADEFMDAWAVGGWYALVQATAADPTLGITPRDYRLAYRKGYFNRGTTESIISVRKSNSTSYHDKQLDLQDDFGCGASLNWVNKFPWADGTPFPEDFNWENPSRPPFFKSDPNGTLVVGSAKFTETRDPRLYENICVPGDLWKDGKVGKCYDNHDHHQENCPGFLMMKFILQQKTDRDLPPHWPLMRLPEVLLNAAEAYNEADGGPSEKAYGWIDAVRARVGLPGIDRETVTTKEQFRDALILERELEFGFEEVRWFDMIRWGLTDAFTTPLKALSSIGDKGQNATSFKFSVYTAYPPRPAWTTKWDTKWYMSPIPAVEINKRYGMTQNPGW